ncbi:MAG: hypothetical protein U0T02_02155 [Solirubrobacteraceae bacterium]
MRIAPIAATGFAAIAVAGCGAGGYANDPRPPRPLNIGAFINGDRVTISPGRIGGGPATIVVTNQSRVSQDLSLRGARDADSCTPLAASTGPINPQGTATFKVSLTEGACTLSTRDSSVAPARLEVGARRPTSQNDLLLP